MCVNFWRGKCRLGLFDGSPSSDDCGECDKYLGPSRGLGDKIANLTKKTGVEKVVRLTTELAGKPCNCGKRRKKLNDKFPTRSTDGDHLHQH